MRRRLISTSLFVLIFLVLTQTACTDAGSFTSPLRLLVKYRVPQGPISFHDQTEKALSEIGVQRIVLSTFKKPDEILKDLRSDPNVEYVEIDRLEKAASILPNDPGFDSQYALDMLNIPHAWGIERGKDSIIVALLDTGVDISHSDLNGRLVPGHNYINKSMEPIDDSITSHGTGLAGIIAANIDNGVGISGATWAVKIMPMKVLDDQGRGYESDIAAAIIDATNRGAGIINLSFGSKNPSKVLEEAIRYALSHNVSIIAAAGNDGGPVNFPAAFEGVISVGALGTDKNVLPFSNKGEELGMVAPGAGINSIKKQSLELNAYHGTSAAAAYVTGVAALVKSYKPEIKPNELRDILYRTATDVDVPGFDTATGYGLVNAWGALAAVSGGNGIISGTVKLGSIGLPGISVVLAGTGVSTKTNMEGIFIFNALPPGNYDISVSLSGYTSQRQSVSVVKDGGLITLEPLVFAQEAEKYLGGLTPLAMSPRLVGYASPFEFRIDSRQIATATEKTSLIATFFTGSATPQDEQWLKQPVRIQEDILKERLQYQPSRGDYTLKTTAPLADGEYYIVISEMDQEINDDYILGWSYFRVARNSISPAFITLDSQRAAGPEGLVIVNNGAQVIFKNAFGPLLPGDLVAFSLDPLSPESAKDYFRDLQPGWQRTGKTWFVAGVLANGDANQSPLALEQPISLSLPVENNQLNKKDTNIGLYWWNGNSWSFINSAYDSVTNTVKGSTVKTGVFTVMAYMPAFTDVKGSWAKNEIEILASMQIIKGVTASMFAPERTITRGQLAALLSRALDLKIEKTEIINSARFTDVSTSYWGYNEIETATAAGLVNGYTDGSFRPNQPVTREQLAVMLVRALNYLDTRSPDDSSALARFIDHGKVSPALAGQVGAAVKLGIVRGSGTGYLLPKSTATRAEAAVMLYRMLGIGGLS